MAVSIRLRREGAKNRPYYRVVVADSRSPRDGKFIEIIGTYDPKKTGQNSSFNVERAEYWISKGAQPSDTVRSLIKKKKKMVAAEPASEAERESSEPAEGDSPPPRRELARRLAADAQLAAVLTRTLQAECALAHQTSDKIRVIRVHSSRRSCCAKRIRG